MIREELTQRICQLPRDFLEVGNLSIVDLLRRTGYYDNRELLTTQGIQVYLRSHPGLLDDWIGYSEDKRTSRGWYLERNTDSKPPRYILGYLPRGEETEFTSAEVACSEFIIREVGEIAGGAP